MTTSTAKKIDASKVKNGMLATVKASFLLQAYYNVIESTPLFQLPQQADKDSQSKIVEDWPHYQQSALDHAKEFMKPESGLNQQMINTLGGILGFAREWEHFYNKLLEKAQHIDQGNNKKMFVDAMHIFQKAVKKEAETVKPVIGALHRFLEEIEADERNFNQATLLISSAMAGEKGEIAELESTIDALHSAIKKDNAMIAGGAAMMVVGIVMVVGGIFGEIETAGVSTALVVGGLAVAVAGAAMDGVAGKDLEKSTKALKDKVAELDKDKKIFTLVKNANANIAHMKEAVAEAITAVQSLADGWDSLNADFGNVATALSEVSADDEDWIPSELEAANSDWQDTLKLATELQANGTVKVQKKQV